MRVMLVDDQPLFRNGVASLMEAWGHQVVAEACDGREAVAKLPSAAPDLILMDIGMPVMGGLEATRLIKAQNPDVKIVMLTVSDDERDLFEAVKNGAHSYLQKDLEASQFFQHLEAIAAGEVVIPARLAVRLIEEFNTSTRASDEGDGPEVLSLRQREILSLVATGLTNKKVAELLFISENTVKFHMKNILEKLHVRSRNQAIAWAARQSQGEPSPG